MLFQSFQELTREGFPGVFVVHAIDTDDSSHLTLIFDSEEIGIGDFFGNLEQNDEFAVEIIPTLNDKVFIASDFSYPCDEEDGEGEDASINSAEEENLE